MEAELCHQTSPHSFQFLRQMDPRRVGITGVSHAVGIVDWSGCCYDDKMCGGWLTLIFRSVKELVSNC